MLSQLVAGRVKCILCDSTGRELLEAYARFSLDFGPMCLFPLLIFSCILSLLKHSYEYDYMMFSETSYKSLDLGVTSDTPCYTGFP